MSEPSIEITFKLTEEHNAFLESLADVISRATSRQVTSNTIVSALILHLEKQFGGPIVHKTDKGGPPPGALSPSDVADIIGDIVGDIGGGGGGGPWKQRPVRGDF